MKALRDIPETAGYKEGDVMVLFGELFSKGYANGIVDEAEKLGMTIVRSTVGRRDADGSLRPLNAEESDKIPQPFINIPLEAGFDMEPDATGVTPCDQLKGVKMADWNGDLLDWNKVEDSRSRAVERFRNHVTQYMDELDKHIPEGANVLFVHTMAGGVPRAKILMPTMNKIFKGRGDRFIPSEDFWNSALGKLCDINFKEVTAYTLKHLVDLSKPIRDKVNNSGGKTAYVAYGYHGTEVLMNGQYEWQTYSPYVQGWAKMELETVCQETMANNISATVFNCPEILTNSSSIFQGVEVSLYPLMGAILQEGNYSQYCNEVLDKCKAKLQENKTIDEIMEFTETYFHKKIITENSVFEKWPQHNTAKQMELMLDSSNFLIDMHKDKKDLITYLLSEEVFKASGQLMLHASWDLQDPIVWLNHDIIAKQMAVNA